MTAKRWAGAVAEYQYHGSAGCVRPLRLRILASRLAEFRTVFRNDMKFRAALAGRELK